jgi:hypothetical protein
MGGGSHFALVPLVPIRDVKSLSDVGLRKLLHALIARADRPLLLLLAQTVRCADRLRDEQRP